MKEYTYEEFCKLPMTLVYHISSEREYTSVRINKETDVGRISITPNEYNGYTGNAEIFYTFDHKTYDTSDQVYVAYMEKVCGVTS